jgi:hypothetical protein
LFFIWNKILSFHTLATVHVSLAFICSLFCLSPHLLQLGVLFSCWVLDQMECNLSFCFTCQEHAFFFFTWFHLYDTEISVPSKCECLHCSFWHNFDSSYIPLFYPHISITLTG